MEEVTGVWVRFLSQLEHARLVGSLVARLQSPLGLTVTERGAKGKPPLVAP
jgi:hypothetical protein